MADYQYICIVINTSFMPTSIIHERVMKRILSQILSIIHRLSLQMSDEPVFLSVTEI